MDQIEEQTCVKFMTRSNQEDYLNIYSGKGCFSRIGRARGKQPVSLRVPTSTMSGCLENEDILHELTHALGFIHMQDYADRDDYLTINWENIEDDQKRYYETYPHQLFNRFGTPYDFESIMHYGSNGYLFTTRDISKMFVIGTGKTLSTGDVERINRMYDCKPKSLVATSQGTLKQKPYCKPEVTLRVNFPAFGYSSYYKDCWDSNGQHYYDRPWA